MPGCFRYRLLLAGSTVALGLSTPSSALAQDLRLQLVQPTPASTAASPASKARAAGSRSEDASSAQAMQPQLDCSSVLAMATDRPLRLVDILRAVVCSSAALREGPALSQQSQAALARARAAMGPSVRLNSRVESATDLPRQASLGLQLDWTLYDFGARSAEIRRSEAAIQAVNQQQGSRALEAAGQAAQLHAAAVSALGRVDAASENLRIAGESARLAQARHGGGAGTISEKLQAEAALSQARVEHARATNRWLSARAALASAMGLPPQTEILLAPSENLQRLEVEKPFDLAVLAREVVEEHPRVLAARSRVEEARLRSDSARAERWGTVGLSVNGSRGQALADRSGTQSRLAAVEWQLPLLDRGLQQSRESDLGAQQALRQVDLDEARRLVGLQVWQSGQALFAEQQGLRASRQALEAAQLSLDAARERYRMGVGSFADLLNAQGAAAQGRLQLVEAQANLVLAHLQLAAASGRVQVTGRPGSTDR
jgi:outer membrane protein